MAKEKKEAKRFYRCHHPDCGKAFEVGTGWLDERNGEHSNVECQKCGKEGEERRKKRKVAKG